MVGFIKRRAIFKVNLHNYNSNIMKQKHTSFKSNKARPRLSSLSDLITNSENTMLSSQATVTSQ